MGPTSPSLPGAPSRRRNGRMQACEPCRKRKVACDHTTPACRRCRARNIPGDCVYIAASPYTSSTTRRPTRRRVTDTIIHARVSDTLPASVLNSVSPSNANGIAGGTDPGAGRRHRGPSTVTSPGYLGFTSFSAVFKETQNSLSLNQTASTVSSNAASPRAPGMAVGTTSLSPQHLETCLTVLQRIPTQDVGLPLFLQHINPNDAWIRLAAQRLIESLYTTFSRQLGKRRSLRDLQEMAELISQNTNKSWSENEPDVKAWVASFSGVNIRWECIGVLFAYWSIASTAFGRTQPATAGKASSSDHKDMMLMCKETAALCVELCKGHSPNSLLLFLMYKHAILESVVAGDASFAFWRLKGETTALATYLGLHAIPADNTYTPTASSEAKRRLISQIFVIDKVAASFCGRPPQISRKYILTPLPLDLPDEALMADAATLAQAVGTLDSKGWNTDGKLYSTTILRARCLLAYYKDEIMEIALSNSQYTSTEALIELKSSEHDIMLQFPVQLKYSPDTVRDSTVDSGALYAKILVHLEHLQNLFFILRLLVQRGHNSHAELLGVSFEMVSVTLVFWTHMDRLAGLHGDFEWLVMAFAVPAGGILCNELLNPSLQLNPVPDVTRSGIIQQLSLLIGFLGWVSPSAPNGDLCSSCKAVIQHVLDQSLNASVDSTKSAIDHAYDFNMDLSSNINDYFNFDLLDTFDWLRPEAGSSQQAA